VLVCCFACRKGRCTATGDSHFARAALTGPLCDRFVATRRPCILTGKLEGSNFAAWTNSYLREKAGDALIDVEHRSSARERYGKGNSRRMKFKDFMKKFSAKDDTVSRSHPGSTASHVSARKLPVPTEGGQSPLAFFTCVHKLTCAARAAALPYNTGDAERCGGAAGANGSPRRAPRRRLPGPVCAPAPLRPAARTTARAGPGLSARAPRERSPAVMGNLVPCTYTLWMGHNKEESSSGLHHGARRPARPGMARARLAWMAWLTSGAGMADFHDNLYVLLRGRKRFRLFSPDDAGRMYTHGAIARVHANGRICYEVSR
jgi:hypothetical protein